MRRFAADPRARAVAEGTTLELPQEAEVVLPEGPDAGDSVAQLRRALDAHAEREAGVLVRIPADELVEVRVDHAGAAHLDPARALARRATCAAADRARHVGLHRRLREGEVMRTETHLALRPVQLPHHVEERPLEIGHRDALVD